MTLRALTLCSKQGELESHCSRPCPVKFWATSNDGVSGVSLEILLHHIPHSDFFHNQSHVTTCAHYLLLFFCPEESGFSFSPPSGSWRPPLRLLKLNKPSASPRLSSQSVCPGHSGGPHCMHWQHLLCTGEPPTLHGSPAILYKVWNREE